MLSSLSENVIVTRHASEADWLEFREGLSIGASEVADVLNIDGCYLGAYALACRKLGLADMAPTDTKRLERGKRFEKVVLEYFAETTGLRVEHLPPFTTMQHRAYPGLFATPDALFESADGEIGPLEAKVVERWLLDEWGAEPPLKFLVQNQAQMLCCDAKLGAVCGMFPSEVNDLLRYAIQQPHEVIQQAIWREVAEFLDLLRKGGMPVATGHPMTSKALFKRHPKDSGETIWLHHEGAEKLRQYEAAEAAVKSAERDFDAVKNQIKALMGDATCALFDGGEFSWKHEGGNPGKSLSVDPALAQRLIDAGIPYEHPLTPEKRVLRKKKEK